MKSLLQIKNEYAIGKKFKSWEDFCFMANDGMFAAAVDEIACLYADYRTRFILNINARKAIMKNAWFSESYG